MIRIFIFEPLLAGTPNPGPFCIKLETALRLAGIPYETSYTTNPSQGPKLKVPFAEIDGRRMGDSTLILNHLKSVVRFDLDVKLSPAERGQSHALQRLIEERLYFVVLYSRWMEDANWVVIKGLYFGMMPLPLRHLVPRLARKSVRNTLHAQGMGRHKRDEIYALGAADLNAMSDMLGDKPFFFGAEPSMADTSAYAMLITIIGPSLQSPLKQAALSHPNLVAYTERMGELYAGAGRKLKLAA
ncbi:MAG: glutathione S-transferase family protein [Parvibaculum sp.]|nr:glutathione S-transferase family protein [Parvibaculum sp.]